MSVLQWDDASLDAVDIQTSDLSKYKSSLRQWQGVPGVCWGGGDRMFATWYSGGKTEGIENYVIVVKSDDAGATWSAPIAIIDPPGNVRESDPTLWCDNDGRVWLFWSQGWATGDGMTWDGRSGVWCSVCDNPMSDELNWSKSLRICDGVMINKPWVDRNGRWLLPVTIFNREPFHPCVDENHRSAGLVVSEDNGKTFNRTGGVKILDNTFDEHVVFDRSDGSLVLWARTADGMAESISKDGGVTWCAAYKNGLDCPNSRFSIAKTGSGRLLLVNHYKPRMDDSSNWRGRPEWYGRNNIAVLLSEDEGKNWVATCMLDERQGVSYPDVDVDEDGRIAVVYDYERNNEGAIYVMVMTEDEILNGKKGKRVCIDELYTAK